MQIKNVKVAFLNEAICKSGYPHQTGEPKNLYIEGEQSLNTELTSQDKDRAFKLANTPIGSGHNNFLKGIIVQFDLKYPQYFTPQLQRYHWIDIISSQSKMHKLTSIGDISQCCNKYVLKSILIEIEELIEVYNKEKFPHIFPSNFLDDDLNAICYRIESKEECFQYIISNLPMGYEMWMGISTNYLQLKTIYNQRKNHKLKDDWGYFCKWIETLPMSELITI